MEAGAAGREENWRRKRIHGERGKKGSRVWIRKEKTS